MPERRMIHCYALPNLTAQNVEPCEPWKWAGRLLVPEECLKDKDKRTAWASNPATRYQMFTYYEGVNSSVRVSDANQPAKMGGFTLDIDIAFSEEMIMQTVKEMKLKPNWVEKTLSGCWRLHWLFARQLSLASKEFAKHLLSKLPDLLPVNKIPGVDMNALYTPSRMFTNSGDWRFIHDTPVSEALLEAFLMKHGAKFGFDENSSGPVITITEKVIERLKERYPRFVEWEGEFKENAQGPSFFIEGSASGKSAIVHGKGIYSWAGHAEKNWWPWTDLLGLDWVKEYEATRIGNAVREIYYDDKTFHVFSPITGNWIPESKENILNELLVNRGLSREFGKKAGAKHSEIESAINYIRHSNRIAGAASFAFYKKGLMTWNGGRYLNTHTREVMPPAEVGEWGNPDHFPWLSMYLDQFFTSPIQLQTFLSWLSRTYRSFYNREPESGQILFLVGPRNSGKTFLNHAVLAAILGGQSDPKAFLLGKTDFNDQLFTHGLWCLDDASVGSYSTLHRYFSEMLKMLAANQSMKSHAKFGKQSQVSWQGRLVVTCNDDTESARLIPRLDINILDKLLLLRVAPRSMPFPDAAARKKILERELPHFCRFLLNYQIPKECLDEDPRYGVLSHHDESLVAMANHTDSAFNEILDHWMVEHFTTRDPNADCWEGTTLQLRQEILKDPTMIDMMRSYDLDEMKRRLTKLASGSLFHIEVKDDDKKRTRFRICRETHCPKPAEPVAAVPPALEKSKFQKQ